MKTCSACHISKPKTDFYKDKSKKDGLTHRCKECEKAYSAKRYREKNLYTPRKKIELKCVVCESLFKGRPNKKYCSDSCKWRAQKRTIYTITCKGCGKEGQVTSKHSKYCSQECFHKHDDFNHVKEYKELKICETCNKEYETGCTTSKYCSDECNPNNWKRCSVSFNNCKMCGELFATNNKAKSCCSDKCNNEYHDMWWKQYAEQVHKEKYSNPLDRPICKVCNNRFLPEYGSKKRVICSNKCEGKYKSMLQKRNRLRRKALKKGAKRTQFINPDKVLKRDKYRCQLCGCKTPKRLRGTFRGNAPEIDHIVPLSKGGNHTYNNVQVLCRSCNQNKSDMYVGQQPILFA